MRLDSAAIILASVVLSSGSQILLKSGMTTEGVQNAIKTADAAKIALTISTSPLVILGFVCFGLSLVLWLFILSHEPLSSAYPFVALGILVTVFAGSLLFAEPISLAKAAGAGLIAAGVILVGIAG
jgi:multidrug transporter EmrE-like cation transporter